MPKSSKPFAVPIHVATLGLALDEKEIFAINCCAVLGLFMNIIQATAACVSLILSIFFQQSSAGNLFMIHRLGSGYQPRWSEWWSESSFINFFHASASKYVSCDLNSVVWTKLQLLSVWFWANMKLRGVTWHQLKTQLDIRSDLLTNLLILITETFEWW